MKKGQKKGSGALKNSLGVAIIGAMLSSVSHASYTPLSSDIELARKLIDYKSIDLKDLALSHLEKMSSVYPDQKDNINLLIAEIYHLQNQNRKFDEQIGQIKTDSKIYDKALLLTALRERSRGKNDLAVAAYDKYFGIHSSAPEEASERALWMNACDVSSTILTSMGNIEAANNRKDMKIKAIESAPEDPGKKMALRRVALEKAMQELSHADNLPDVNDPALSFPKGDGFVSLNNVKLTNKFTFECMVKEDFTDGSHTLASITDSKDVKKRLFVVELKRTKQNALTEIVASYTPDGGGNRVIATRAVQNRSDWYQLSVSFDGNKLIIYKNGDEIASASRGLGSPAGNVNVFLGGTHEKGAFKGSVDNFRIWNSVRSSHNINLDVFSGYADSKDFVINCNFDEKNYKSTTGVVGVLKGQAEWIEKNARRLKVLKNVEALQANTMGSDYVAGVSVAEIAHAYYLAGDYRNVAATVRQNTDFLVLLEDVIGKQSRGDISNSPLGAATYYFAMAYKATAEQNIETKPEVASKAFTTAMDQLSVVINKYGRSRYGNMAKLAMSDINPQLDKLGWSSEQKAKYAEHLEAAGFDGGKLKADNAFRDKNYDVAIDNYRQAFSSRLRGRGVGSALYNTLVSYLNLSDIQLGNDGRYWEVEAVADHLLYIDPTSEEAARACQQIGRFYARLSSNKDLSPADQKKYRDAAAIWYEEFVRMRPNDEQAPQFKFLVAESQRSRIIPIQAEVKAAEDAVKAEKDATQIEALNLKLSELKLSEQGLIHSIIPKYLDIVAKYPNDADGYGSRAARTLGQLYSLVGDRANSSEMFVKAANLIKDVSRQTEVPEYYKMAGDEWMRSSTPAKAL
ncbi:MAG: LamG-like jellyroll fold domain-containing protein, partial [Lentisphaeria bacterium]